MSPRDIIGGDTTLQELRDRSTQVTAYCNNLRCARAKRAHGRALDLETLDPAMTLGELRARLKCVDCNTRQSVVILTPASDEERASEPRVPVTGLEPEPPSQ